MAMQLSMPVRQARADVELVPVRINNGNRRLCSR
jgi:hypothetical protein